MGRERRAPAVAVAATGAFLLLLCFFGVFITPNDESATLSAALRSLEASTRHHRTLQDDDLVWDEPWVDDENTNEENGVVTEDVVIALPIVALSLVHNLFIGIPSAVRNWTGKRLCRTLGTARTCVCTEEQLRDKINAATRNRYNPIKMCPATTVELTQGAIDVSDRSFRLLCSTTLFQSPQCGVADANTANSSSMFTGAPLDASFQDITFENGKATTGGAVHLTGGIMRVLRGGFVGNTATEKGGALYVGPSAEVRLLMNPYFDGNTAPIGRDVYITTSGDSTTKSSDKAYVLCKRAGYLVRPQFCQGVDGIAVGNGGNTTLIVTTRETNCHLPEHGEFSC